jgi:hypothetical protein
MTVIFISYRRDDSRGDTGRLYDRLSEHFGKKQVFRDIDAISPGEQFPEVLDHTLQTCDVLLAIIGPKWLTARKGKQRRLDNPDDFVRLEIATALERGIPVIPVLVGNASMPRSQALPETLAPLGSYQAVVLHELHFQRDVDTLIDRIQASAGTGETRRTIARTINRERPWSYRDPDWFSDTAEHICPPLQIEWPPKVVPRVRGDGPAALSKDLETLIDQMLQRLWQAKGVIIPGIAMSQTPADSDEYVIRVSGVLTSQGKLSLSGRSEQQTKMLEIPVRDLENAIYESLPSIIGHQEIANLVAVSMPEALEEIIQTGSGLSDLVLVSRALLRDSVSLVPFKTILGTFLHLHRAKNPLVEVVEEIRCLDEIRPLLPGNDGECSFVALSSEIERQVRSSLDFSSSQPVLAIDPEQIQNIWASVAAEFETLTTDAIAILVSNNSIRPFVRNILKLQYPNLQVLSRKELLPNLSSRIIGTVS